VKTISTPQASQPAGHYSQAIVSGGVVYVAGQLGRDPAAPNDPPGDAATQTVRALASVAAILDAAGSSLGHLLQVTIYVTDIGLWGEINEAYAAVLGSHRPARAIVPIGPLAGGYVLEVVATAELP